MAASSSTTKSSTVTFDPKDIQGAGKQLRHRGITDNEYKQPLSLIRKAVRGNEAGTTAVHAVIHHGWRTGADAAVPKKQGLEDRKADKTFYEVGKPTAPQLAAAMNALASAGVDVNLLKPLWAVFSGDPA